LGDSAVNSRADSLFRLFKDDDPSTVVLVKEQLVLKGDDAVSDLRDLVSADSAIVAKHAQEVLHAIAGKRAIAELESVLRCEAIFLEETSWLISESLMPWIDLSECRSRIDEWGGELRKRMNSDDCEDVVILTNYMHGDLGFDGNSTDYYNHDNSILPCVIENRMGLPLMLCLLYSFVAERAGMTIHGVNLPGHFIARCGNTYFDPFHSGRILTLADCADILARQNIELSDEHLENPGCRDVMARMLANLGHAYEIEEAVWQKGLVDRWLGILTGAEQ
jgi:regulator of sirC expression with transglutaminase-like and TPR domain